MKPSPFIHSRLTLFVLITLLSFLTNKSQAQSSAPPPQKLWISLGYSTSRDNKVNQDWLREECMGGRIISHLHAGDAVIVPIFDNGQCFYETALKPFRHRNPNSITDEKAIRQLLLAAKIKKVSIFFALNLLEWQQNKPDSKSVMPWTFASDLQETASSMPTTNDGEALYASPFQPEVRSLLVQLVKEVAEKFPDAAGAVLDLHLSRTKIMGYSETSRAASIRSIGVDPTDLNLFGGLGVAVTPSVRQWITWRSNILNSLLGDLSKSYRRSNPNGRILTYGVADFNAEQDFNSLRSGQDWQSWLQAASVDAILVEGDWSPTSRDTNMMHKYLESSSGPSASDHSSIYVVPVVVGGGRTNEKVDYGQGWATLKGEVNSLREVGLVVQDSQEIKDAQSLVSGLAMTAVSGEHPELGTIMPGWRLQDASGATWSSFRLLGNPATLILSDGVAETTAIIQKLQRRDLRLMTPTMIVTRTPIKSSRLPGGVINLADPAGQLLRFCAAKSALVLVVDQAGFVRTSTHFTDATTLPTLLRNSTRMFTPIYVGKVAPEFSVKDMNGRTIRLADYRGRRQLLITFFPVCVECESQLTSLRFAHARFDRSNTDIIAVSNDSSVVQHDFASALHLNMPFVPDIGFNLSMLFGAARDTSGALARRSVLIDRRGIIRIIDIDVNPQMYAESLLRRMAMLHLAPSEAPMHLEVKPALEGKLGVLAPGATSESQNASSYEFGKVSLIDTQVVNHVFTLINQGKLPLTIRRVDTSCGCTSAVLQFGNTVATKTPIHNITLLPGQSCSMNVSVDLTKVELGSVDKGVYIFTNNLEQPTMVVRIVGSVTSGVDFTPKTINFGQIQMGQPTSQTVSVAIDSRLITNDDAAYLASNNTAVHLSLAGTRKVKQDKSGSTCIVQDYLLKLDADAPLGLIVGQITFVYPKKVNLSPDVINVVSQTSSQLAGQVVGDVSAHPVMIALGAVHIGQKVSQKLVLTSTNASALDGIQVSDNDSVKVNLETAVDGTTTRTIEVTVEPHVTSQGLLQTAIRFTLKNGQKMVIPVLGYIEP